MCGLRVLTRKITGMKLALSAEVLVLIVSRIQELITLAIGLRGDVMKLPIKIETESFFRRVVKHMTRMKWVVTGRLKWEKPVYTKNSFVEQKGVSLSESYYRGI